MAATTTHPVKQKATAVKAAAKKQPLAVYGPNLGKGHTFHVMAKTDRKGKTKMYSGEPPILVEATTVQAVVEFVYADQLAESPDATWNDYASEFKILPSAAKQLGLTSPKKTSTTNTTGKTPARSFPDSTGRDIKGDRVKLDGKVIGTAAYRVMDGKRSVPRIGVELATTGAGKVAATLKGRTLKRRCFDAADLTVA